MSSRLCQLAEKYRSDKVASIFHDYTPFYDELLRGREVKHVLEIGIGTPAGMPHMEGYQTGASLRMWREYFPEAEIWGIDNNPDAMISEEPRIHVFLCDQSDEFALSATAAYFTEKFDLIIDDGSHRFEDQALTANIFIPQLLSPNGVYVIEDVWSKRELYALLPFNVEVKMFNLKRTSDDCLFIIKGENQ